MASILSSEQLEDLDGEEVRRLLEVGQEEEVIDGKMVEDEEEDEEEEEEGESYVSTSPPLAFSSLPFIPQPCTLSLPTCRRAKRDKISRSGQRPRTRISFGGPSSTSQSHDVRTSQTPHS